MSCKSNKQDPFRTLSKYLQVGLSSDGHRASILGLNGDAPHSSRKRIRVALRLVVLVVDVLNNWLSVVLSFTRDCCKFTWVFSNVKKSFFINPRCF